MQQTKIIAVAAFILASWVSAAKAVEILPVFVFAGQSNANGFGIPSQLPASLQQAQPNVLFDNAFVNATPAWAPLQAPTEPSSRYDFGGQYLIDYANGAFGAELTTGLGISAAMGGQQVAEVKFSLGATSLAVDWNPDNPGGNMLYPTMVSRVNASVAALQSQNPTKAVQIKGFFWMQGESDGDGPRYQTDLTNLIAHVRTDFGNPNLPFVIGQLGAAWTGNAIAQAQAAVGTPGSSAYVHDTLMVRTADLPIIFDGMHFNTVGVQRLGDRYAAAYATLTGLPVVPGNAVTATVADLNSLSGAAVMATAGYGGFAPASAIVDGGDNAAAPFIFTDAVPNYVNISGLNGTSMSALRIFDNQWPSRTPTSVSVYYSSVNTTSLNPADYTLLGTTSDVTYATTSANSFELNHNGGVISYADISAAIPAGTKSILLGLDSGSWPGPAVAEIQGIVGANVLRGKPVTASSFYNDMEIFAPVNATDGLTNAHVFAESDETRSMTIMGFESSVGMIRVWRDMDRVPDTVTISSTTDSANYAALTEVTGLRSLFNAQGYVDISVNAPVGTKGLGFVWGAGDNAPGTRLRDIQAFAGTFPVASVAWSGVGDGRWSTAAGLNNWKDTAEAAADYASNAAATFDDTATGTTIDISAANVFPASVTFDNSARDFTVTGTKGIAGSTGLVKKGAGALVLANPNTYTGLTSVMGGTLELAESAQTPAMLSNMVDIQEGKLVFDYSTTSPASTIAAMLDAGYDLGWASGQIINSTAGVTGLSLGWKDDSVSRVTIMATYSGDANLSGTADVADLTALLNSYNKTNMVWANGDFNYDGVVNVADLTALLNNYNKSAGGSVAGVQASTVPEPSTAAALVGGLIVMLGYGFRQRRNTRN